MLLIILVSLLLIGVALVWVVIRAKNIDQWLLGYIRYQLNPRAPTQGLVHVLFCFVDHYEPKYAWPATRDIEAARVKRWLDDYPKMAAEFRDADGKGPQHSFFYPIDEWDEEFVTQIAGMCATGCGEVEIHLHHDNDTSENLRKRLIEYRDHMYYDMGLLGRSKINGQPQYAFIHGLWALGNGRRDGKYCGVNDELTILQETGCFADYTLPSAPSDGQTVTINSIYRAIDDPCKPKSHEHGRRVRFGSKVQAGLMIVQGVLLLDWRNRKFGVMPRIENSDVRTSSPPTPARVDSWIKAGVSVEGQPNWVVVKLHTHGAPERDADTLLGERIRQMHRHLNKVYNDGVNYKLHYVTARELYNVIRAAEDGLDGDPNEYRNYEVEPPVYQKRARAE